MTTRNPGEVWPAPERKALRQFWGQGLSATEIGRRMNISKNAVCGQRRRMGLAPRPSPIRRTA